MALFDSIKSAIVGVKNQLLSLDQQISELEDERAKLVSLPLPYDDFVDWALSRYDNLAKNYAGQWRGTILGADSSMRSFYMAPVQSHETLADFEVVYGRDCPINFEKPTHSNQYFPMTDGVFFTIFRDAIKEGVRRMLDESVKPEWPSRVGPARAERIPKIEKLEAKLSALIAERDEIRSGLSSAVGQS